MTEISPEVQPEVQPEPTQQTETTPTLILGKYKDQDALIAAYKEAESTLSRKNQELAQLKQHEANTHKAGLEIKQESDQKPIANIKSILEKAKLSADEIINEWKQSGQLTDKQYKAFERYGYDRGDVNDYIAGQQARAQLYENQQHEIRRGAVSMLGGEDAVQTLLHFASSLDEARRNDLQQRLGDPTRYRGAIIELADAYNQENNLIGSKAFIVGSGSGSIEAGVNGNRPFNSRAEAVSAARNARAVHGGRQNDEYKDAEFNSRLKATDFSKL